MPMFLAENHDAVWVALFESGSKIAGYATTVVVTWIAYLQWRINATARQSKEAIEQNTRVTTAFAVDAKKQVAEVREAAFVTAQKVERVRETAEQVAEIAQKAASETQQKVEGIAKTINGQRDKIAAHVSKLQEAMEAHGIECPPHPEEPKKD